MATASATARVKLEIEALLRSVAIHRGQQDLARAESGDLARVSDRLDPGRPPAAMGEDFPARRFAGRADPLGVDGDDHALGLHSKLSRRSGDELPVVRIAAEFIEEILSAPASATARGCSVGARTPPPTVRGMKHTVGGAPDDVDRGVRSS